MFIDIGHNIRHYRNLKGVSQADVASYIGVSAQAVSKWERGGMPDIELLPGIADYLGVTIDALFGRDINNKTTLGEINKNYITSLPEKDQIIKASEIAFELSKAVMTIPEYETRSLNNKTSVKDIRYNRDSFSSNYGLTYGFIMAQNPSILFMAEPEDGFASLFADKEDLLFLFKTLSDEITYDALLFLYKRGEHPFSLDLFTSKMNIDDEKAKSILEAFRRFGLIKEAAFETAKGMQYAYHPKLRDCVVPFLFFSSEVTRDIRMWSMLYSNRTKPLLK